MTVLAKLIDFILPNKVTSSDPRLKNLEEALAPYNNGSCFSHVCIVNIPEEYLQNNKPNEIRRYLTAACEGVLSDSVGIEIVYQEQSKNGKELKNYWGSEPSYFGQIRIIPDFDNETNYSWLRLAFLEKGCNCTHLERVVSEYQEGIERKIGVKERNNTILVNTIEIGGNISTQKRITAFNSDEFSIDRPVAMLVFESGYASTPQSLGCIERAQDIFTKLGYLKPQEM